MQFHDVLSLMNEKYTAFQLLWSFYITVAVGLLAYVAATFKSSASVLIRVMLVISFTLFAAVNLKALTNVREQRARLHNIATVTYEKNMVPLEKLGISEGKGDFKKYLQKAEPTKWYLLIAFHILLDSLVVGIIFLLPGSLSRAKRIGALNKTPIKHLKSNYDRAAIISRDEEGGVWVLEEQFEVATDKYKFIVPKYFKFDLASVPRLFWWFIAPFELSIAAPLVHDYYYRYGGVPSSELIQAEDGSLIPVNPKLDRSEVDLVFLRMMKGEGVSNFRSHIAYYGVRLFGERSWRAS